MVVHSAQEVQYCEHHLVIVWIYFWVHDILSKIYPIKRQGCNTVSRNIIALILIMRRKFYSLAKHIFFGVI